MSKEKDAIIEEIHAIAKLIFLKAAMNSRLEDMSGDIIDLCDKYKSLPSSGK